MFRRRLSPTLQQRLRGLFWPGIGWRRGSRYYAHRVARLKGSPHAIAAGFAAGAAASMIPMVGTHFLIAFAIAWASRGSMLSAAIGTVVGNPWTFPFIWLGSFKLGVYLLGDGGVRNPGSAEIAIALANSLRATITFDLGLFIERVWPIWWPMLIGCIPLVMAIWLLSYFPLRWAIARYQRRRAGHIARS